jgi:hypothetical protein
MERIQIDLLDVHQFAGSNNKIKYLLNVVDHFSKFAWSIPIKHKNKEVVSTKLAELFLVEGFPNIIQSDNGGEFKNWLLHSFASSNGIEIKHSEPYNSSTQGLVEKFNGTLRYMIHTHQQNSKTKRYIDVLPFLVFGYNSTPHKSTKFTPFQILRRKNEVFKIDEIVEKNIKQNAKDMKRKFAKKMSKKKMPQLEAGDYCRIDTKALKQTRKLTQIDRDRLRKHRELNNFTTAVYVVLNVVEFKDDDGSMIPKYFLESVDGKGLNVTNKSFYREQLLKVNSDELIPIQGNEAIGSSDIKVDTSYYGLADEVNWDEIKVPNEEEVLGLYSGFPDPSDAGSWGIGDEDPDSESGDLLDEKHNDVNTSKPTVDYESDVSDDDLPNIPLVLQDKEGRAKKKQLDYAHFAKTGEKIYK